MRFLKKLILLAVVILGLALGTGYLFVTNIDGLVARYRGPIEGWIGAALGGKVSTEKISAHLLPRPRLEIFGVKASFGGGEPAVTAAQIGVDFELLPLLWRNLKLNSVLLVEPTLDLVGDERGVRPRGMLGESAVSTTDVPLFIALERFEVQRGRIEIFPGAAKSPTIIENVGLSGALRFEDGELKISTLAVSGGAPTPLGEVVGEFGVVRSSTRTGEVSFDLQRGRWQGIELSGEGSWRSRDGTGRFTLAAPGTDLGVLQRAVESLLKAEPLQVAESLTFGGTVAPKVTVLLEGPERYKVNGVLELSGGRVAYQNLGVEDLKGAVQLAINERGGRVAVESLRGVTNAGRSPVTIEGAFDLSPVRGEIRGTVGAVPLAELWSVVPTAQTGPLALTAGSIGGRFSWRLEEEQSPRWNVTADLQGGAGTLRGTPFQDGAGKVRVSGGDAPVEVVLEPVTVGFAGGGAPVTVRGELKGERGLFALTAVKFGLPELVSIAGGAPEGVSDVAGEVTFDVKGRVEGGAVELVGPLSILDGAARFGDHSFTKIAGELILQFRDTIRVSTRALRMAINDEPVVVSGGGVGAQTGLRLEQVSIEGFGGQALFDGSISAEVPRRFEVNGRGRGLAVERLMGTFNPAGGASVLQGELSDIRWRLSGRVGEEVNRSLEGGVALRLERGALRGVNIGRIALEKIGTIPLLRNLLGGAIPPNFRRYFDAPDTAIHSLVGEITLREGRARTEDLRLESDLFALSARGEFAFGGAVDIGATLGFEREFAYALADRMSELRGLFGREGTIVLPLRISGPPTELVVVPDVGALLERAAQTAVQREAERFIEGAIDRLGGRD